MIAKQKKSTSLKKKTQCDNCPLQQKDVTHDFQSLHRIQKLVLKGSIPKNIPGMNIDAKTLSHNQLEGSFFDIFQPNKNIIDVVLGHVMGKGGSSILLANVVKMQIMHFANPFFQVHHYDKKLSWEKNLLSPHDIVQKVHQEVVPILMEIDYFVRVIYGRFNLKFNTFTFVDCGASKPIHYSFDAKTAEHLKGINLPLGSVHEETYHSVKTSFKPGDLFAFTFSGIDKSFSLEDQPLLPKNIGSIIEANYNQEVGSILNEVEKAVVTFARKEGASEELTAILVKINEKKDPESEPTACAKFASDLSQLAAVRNFIKQFVHRAPGNVEKLSFQMQVAINEIFCNIVKHSYNYHSNQEILIECALQEKYLEITVSDTGIVFNPSLTKHPSLTGDKDTGYGWFIIQQICDHVYYTPKTSDYGWNYLKIFKYYISEEEVMDFSHRVENQILIITINEETLDAKVSQAFKEGVLNLIKSLNLNRVILELNRLQFIDSSGLGTFLSIQRFLNSIGGTLKLTQLNKPVRTMFEIVSMHRIFEIYTSTEEAVGAS